MPIQDVQQTGKQHAVPQNIMDVEFKIIGDLTMRQFFYLLIFWGLAYVVYITGVPSIIKWPVILITVLGGVAFAFLPVEDRGVDEWIINFFKAIYAENQLLWRKEPTPPAVFLYENVEALKQEMITLAPTTSRRKLEEYLETEVTKKPIDPLDIPEEEYIRKVHEAFARELRAPTVTEVETPLGALEEEIPVPEYKPPIKTEEEPKEKPKALEKTPPKAKETLKPKEKFVLPKKAEVPLMPITPDRHSGRKFTNFLPEGGEIILPIRGERVLETTEEIEIEEDIKEKTQQLKQLLGQIREDETLKPIIEKKPEKLEEKEVEIKTSVPETPIPLAQPELKVSRETDQEAEISRKTETTIQELRLRNEQLTRDIEQLKAELLRSQRSEEEQKARLQKIEALEQQKKQTSRKIASLKHTFGALKKDVEIKEAIATPVFKKIPKLSKAKTVPLESKTSPISANMLSGFVKDAQGKATPNLVVIIKDHRQEPVRALKTNSLGQFSISSPLANGSYTVEVDVSNRPDLTFDIINFEAKGEPIPNVEFIGK